MLEKYIKFHSILVNSFMIYSAHSFLLLSNLNVYVCEAPPGDLNSNPYSSHLTNTYTCEVTITPSVCCGIL